MKKSIFILLLIAFRINASAQFVARLQLKDSIAGICDMANVYALFPGFGGQVEAHCPVSKEDILNRLNTEVTYLKANPKFKGKGMIGIIINCKGKVVQCKMDNTTGNTELDAQIEAVFNSLGEWKAGKLNDLEVDSSRLFSFKIKKGVISFDY